MSDAADRAREEGHPCVQDEDDVLVDPNGSLTREEWREIAEDLFS